MTIAKLEWRDCDITNHADGLCFMAIDEDGKILRDCEDN